MSDRMSMSYPVWVCHDCGLLYGRGPIAKIATYHTGECGLCNRASIPVTEPRDFGHLNIPSLRFDQE